DDTVIENALHWLRESSASVKKPFVLAINFLAPHFPHYTTPRLWEKYSQHADLSKFGSDQPTAQHPRAKEVRDHFRVEEFSEEDQKGLRQGYYACIDYLDQQLGRLRAALETLGLRDSTNLFYASDHGEMLGKFGMWWKCSLYEDSARIPIIAEGPDFSGGKTVTTPVNLLDLQAEFFASTGSARPKHMVGTPLSQILDNDPSRVCFSEYQGHGNSESSFMLRKGDWKLIYHINAPHQLFDLAVDPDELENLYTSNPEKAAELESELRLICNPEYENQKTDLFVSEQLRRIADEDLEFSLYNQEIGEKPSPSPA
ncbi:MAG: sulfatase-like hydrolase/transferase, partial [Verrucomicrobiota bacterium]